MEVSKEESKDKRLSGSTITGAQESHGALKKRHLEVS
jgi:hypothetical protein